MITGASGFTHYNDARAAFCVRRRRHRLRLRGVRRALLQRARLRARRRRAGAAAGACAEVRAVRAADARRGAHVRSRGRLLGSCATTGSAASRSRMDARRSRRRAGCSRSIGCCAWARSSSSICSSRTARSSTRAAAPRTVIRWDEHRARPRIGGDGRDRDGRQAAAGSARGLAWRARRWRATAPVVDAAVASRRRRWRRFFDVDDAEAAALEAAVVPLYRLAMPSLRMNLLTLPGAPPYPTLMRAIEPQLAAGAWLACCRRARVARRRCAGSPSCGAGCRWCARCSARWQTRVTLANGVAPDSTPPEVAAAWTVLQKRATEVPIGEALLSTTLPPSLRPILLAARVRPDSLAQGSRRGSRRRRGSAAGACRRCC